MPSQFQIDLDLQAELDYGALLLSSNKNISPRSKNTIRYLQYHFS